MSQTRPQTDRISIIIPIWRDTELLRKTLEQLGKQGFAEQVVVALGEPDREASAAAEEAGATWLLAPGKGCGRQMNAGAEAARGDILLFLHADTRLPPEAAESVRQCVDGGFVGGAFSRRFDHPGLFLRLTCRLADWRGRIWGWFLGDQTIFVRRDVFESLEGFREWEAFEDLDFARRMRSLGKTRLLNPGVVSSARRFERRGPWRQTLSDFWQTLRYLWRGSP